MLEFLRDRLRPVRAISGDDPHVQILDGVKLYRDVRVGPTCFRGSRDGSSRPIDYVFDIVPPGALAGASVLDLGTAGGAVCFESVQRGAAHAIGVEIAPARIRGARAIKRIAGVPNVDFVHEDFYEFLTPRALQFDLTFVLNVLHHVENPVPLLKRICRSSRRYLVVESPDDMTVEGFSSYSAGLNGIEGLPVRAFGDVIALLELCDFHLERVERSSPDAAFHRGEQAERSLYLFTRTPGVKPRETRLMQASVFRHARSAVHEAARGDGCCLPIPADGNLAPVLRDAFGRDWIDRSVNVLLIGPRASGKSFLYDHTDIACHPPYNPKVFKFPNADGLGGRRKHLNPPRGGGGRLGQVLVSTVDDEGAHCTTRQLAKSLAGRRVVCLLLNVDFDQHFDRLYKRELEGYAGAAVDYEVALRFDITRVLAALKGAGIPYRVLTSAG